MNLTHDFKKIFQFKSALFLCFGILLSGQSHAQVLSTYDISTGYPINTWSLSVSTLGNSTLNNPQALSIGANNFDYVAPSFRVTAPGNYLFGQSLASADTVMIFYSDSFNPIQPALNAIVGNDDYVISIPSEVTLQRCRTGTEGNGATCPGLSSLPVIVGNNEERGGVGSLVTGKSYYMVISPYRNTDSLSVPMSFWCYGPGSCVFDAVASSAFDTLLSLNLNSLALGNFYNLQSAKTAQGLTYDCTVFDANNICVSFAGTRSNGDNGFDATTGALIIAHRPTANIRFGAYVDQNIGTTDSNGLKVKRSSPGYGLFGVWSQRTDGLGTQVRASANSGKVDIETTRLALDTTAEAGFGASNIKSTGIQLEVSQGYAVNNQWVARPYLGYRQATNKRAAYTEMTSESVLFPLTYNGLKQTTESILAGVRFVGKLTPQTSLTLSAGMERDVKSSVDDYNATEATIGDLSLSMAENKKKSRPTASLGVVHYIDKTQTIGLSVVHRKEALQSGNTTTGMLQYSVGF